MTIKPIPRKTLAEVVAGKLAASLIDGSLQTGSQLAPERELMGQFAISRSTLREALKVLADHELIEVRPGIGWFICPITEQNIAKAHMLAAEERHALPPYSSQVGSETRSGPRRLPVAPEKPLHIPNLATDRLGTFDFISWWEKDRVRDAKIMVIGAGALGNEVIKNLALMGIGHIFIIDFDRIEAANLSRSPLFRESDSGRSKAEVAAARVKELNPNVRVQYLNGDVTSQIGLGVIRRMDVLIGCLDNREARLSVNRFSYWLNKPWVDGAIQELLGLVRVFKPGEGACFECTLTEQARRDLAVRYSCPLLARQNILIGKVPTTPTISSIIGALQAQEALKIIHGMPVESGKVLHFNGMTNEMHTSAYLPRADCESHWMYGEIIELPLRTETTTLQELLNIIQADLGKEALIELDQELILKLECPTCKTVENVLKPLDQISFESAHCPACGTLRDTQMAHLITGDEPFLNRTLSSIGVPPLHILRAFNNQEYRFYELAGDLKDALHFNHFIESASHPKTILRHRLHLGEEVDLPADAKPSVRGRVIMHDEQLPHHAG